MVQVVDKERERDRERQRAKERQRERHTARHRHTARQTDRQLTSEMGWVFSLVHGICQRDDRKRKTNSATVVI